MGPTQRVANRHRKEGPAKVILRRLPGTPLVAAGRIVAAQAVPRGGRVPTEVRQVTLLRR